MRSGQIRIPSHAYHSFSLYSVRTDTLPLKIYTEFLWSWVCNRPQLTTPGFQMWSIVDQSPDIFLHSSSKNVCFTKQYSVFDHIWFSAVDKYGQNVVDKYGFRFCPSLHPSLSTSCSIFVHSSSCSFAHSESAFVLFYIRFCPFHSPFLSIPGAEKSRKHHVSGPP